MNDGLTFLSNNFPYFLMMAIGYLVTQQSLPWLALLRGLRYENVDAVVLLINSGAQLLDMRDQVSYNQGHIKGAKVIDLAEKPLKMTGSDTYVLYNKDGHLSYQQISEIKALGHHHIVVLAGGIDAWKQAGFPLKKRGA